MSKIFIKRIDKLPDVQYCLGCALRHVVLLLMEEQRVKVDEPFKVVKTHTLPHRIN